MSEIDTPLSKFDSREVSVRLGIDLTRTEPHNPADGKVSRREG